MSNSPSFIATVILGIATTGTLALAGSHSIDNAIPDQARAERATPVATLKRDAAPTKAKQAELQDISFLDLEFDIEADAPFDRGLLTEEIWALDGKSIRLRGFMLPSYEADGIEEFVLVRDNQVCCFGPGAKICHNSMVAMAPGRTASYTTRVVIVEGTFHIEEFALDGVVYSCFRIVATSVRGT